MHRILRHCNPRHGYDGWALQLVGTQHVLHWSFSTTREEVRELRKGLPADMFNNVSIAKVKIDLQVVP